MTTRRTHASYAAALALGVLALVGCADDNGDGAPPAPAPAPAPTPDIPDSEADAGGGTHSDGCSVHLFDDDNFDESDDHFVLRETGRYETLANLPGAARDWTDEADSIRLGADATVTIWADTDFHGQSVTLEPGSEHPDLDSEPSSLEMTC